MTVAVWWHMVVLMRFEQGVVTVAFKILTIRLTDPRVHLGEDSSEVPRSLFHVLNMSNKCKCHLYL